MSTSGLFNNKWLPLWLAGPQLVIVLIFFYWPTIQALWWSFTLERPFGGGSTFVGLYNYQELFEDPELLYSLWISIVFAIGTTGVSIFGAMLLAVAADRKIRAKRVFRNVLVWPYAIAAPVVGVTFSFLMHPVVGAFSILNTISPELWQPAINGVHAMIMIVLASAWTQIPFFFIIFLSGLQAIPDTYHHAAAIDGAGPWRRLKDIQLPLMTPFIFFALIMGMSDSFTGSFGIIHTMTQGGPGGATNLLVYKIYSDGFVGLDLSGSSAQSVLLMILVVIFTVLNFRFIERKVHYQR